MKYFDRTNRMANTMFVCGVISGLVTAAVLVHGAVVDQIFEFSNGNFVRSGILFAMFAVLCVFFFVLGIALKCIVKDAKDDLDELRYREEPSGEKPFKNVL